MLAGAAGIVLAASAGLRAFLPLLGLGLASRFLGWPIAESMQWLATDAGLIGLSVAALVEIAADKVPAVDHVLDVIHTITGPLAGALVAYTAWGDFSSPAAIVMALALGAPTAAGVHLMAAAVRVKSTVLTAGLGNPAVSVAEDGVSIGAIAIALLAPLVAVVVALAVLFLFARFVVRRMAGPKAIS